jgi:hypothetical protein
LKGAHLRFAVEGARGFRWSVFAVRLRPEVIVVTTSQEMLEQLLDRSTTSQTSRAFPPQLPEWSGVDRTAPVWAIRHYATSGNELDATTPLAAENRGANVVDPMAVGVAFSIHAGPAGRVVVVYYSRNPRALALMQEYWSDPGDHATLQAGPTSIRVTLSRPNDPSLVGLRLLMLVGHAVFI